MGNWIHDIEHDAAHLRLPRGVFDKNVRPGEIELVA